MKKFKLFFSFFKERDWLEEMAAQGWLLTNITAGIIYTFKQIEPCKKVYEIERFAISLHPTVSELTAKSRALDIATQFGWELVTHDEDMNYYFVKDKANDETDEFYDDEQLRKERAERYRKHFSYEQTRGLLCGLLAMSLIYIVLFFLLGKDDPAQHAFMWFYIILSTIEIVITFCCSVWGQHFYTELCMSRAEWTLYKKHSEKKRFKKVQQLRSYLQEKSEFGLALKGYTNGRYLFEEDSQRYNYFIDTKSCLQKRLKEDGLRFTDESKDLNTQSLKWYEISIANAAKYGLKPVAVTPAAINKSVIIYKRPYSDAPLPWENGNENIHFAKPTLLAAVFMLCCFAIGVLVGSLVAIFI